MKNKDLISLLKNTAINNYVLRVAYILCGITIIGGVAYYIINQKHQTAISNNKLLQRDNDKLNGKVEEIQHRLNKSEVTQQEMSDDLQAKDARIGSLQQENMNLRQSLSSLKSES